MEPQHSHESTSHAHQPRTSRLTEQALFRQTRTVRKNVALCSNVRRMLEMAGNEAHLKARQPCESRQRGKIDADHAHIGGREPQRPQAVALAAERGRSDHGRHGEHVEEVRVLDGHLPYAVGMPAYHAMNA